VGEARSASERVDGERQHAAAKSPRYTQARGGSTGAATDSGRALEAGEGRGPCGEVGVEERARSARMRVGPRPQGGRTLSSLHPPPGREHPGYVRRSTAEQAALDMNFIEPAPLPGTS